MNFLNYLRYFLILLLAGCQGTQNGNTQTGNPLVAFAMTAAPTSATVFHQRVPKNLLELLIPSAYAYPAPASMMDANGNTVTMNQNWINIGQIEFKASETVDVGEISGSSVSFQGPYAVDLFSPNPGNIGFNNLNLNQVRRIRIRLARTSSVPMTAPNGFLGRSIFLGGTVNGHNFTFSTMDESEIQIAGPYGVVPVENKTFLLELKTANLIKKINLSSISTTVNINDGNKVSAANPCPTIDNSASDLFTCFRKGLETESNLGRDDDGNFQIDSGEGSVR